MKNSKDMKDMRLLGVVLAAAVGSILLMCGNMFGFIGLIPSIVTMFKEQ